MGFWQIILYLRTLISEGHRWQHKNIVDGVSQKKKYPLSFLQALAVILSVWFVYKNPTGVSDTTIDFLLSSLSIITGFYFTVILLSFEQFSKIKEPDKTASDDVKIKVLKSVNFLKQYNALSCYAILLALTVIFMLICTLLFGVKTNIVELVYINFESSICCNASLLLQFSVVILWRFFLIYFLIDFFIITIYAVCSLFQFINLQMMEKQLPYSIDSSKVMSEYQTYMRRFG